SSEFQHKPPVQQQQQHIFNHPSSDSYAPMIIRSNSYPVQQPQQVVTAKPQPSRFSFPPQPDPHYSPNFDHQPQTPQQYHPPRTPRSSTETTPPSVSRLTPVGIPHPSPHFNRQNNKSSSSSSSKDDTNTSPFYQQEQESQQQMFIAHQHEQSQKTDMYSSIIQQQFPPPQPKQTQQYIHVNQATQIIAASPGHHQHYGLPGQSIMMLPKQQTQQQQQQQQQGPGGTIIMPRTLSGGPRSVGPPPQLMGQTVIGMPGSTTRFLVQSSGQETGFGGRAPTRFIFTPNQSQQQPHQYLQFTAQQPATSGPNQSGGEIAQTFQRMSDGSIPAQSHIQQQQIHPSQQSQQSQYNPNQLHHHSQSQPSPSPFHHHQSQPATPQNMLLHSPSHFSQQQSSQFSPSSSVQSASHNQLLLPSGISSPQNQTSPKQEPTPSTTAKKSTRKKNNGLQQQKSAQQQIKPEPMSFDEQRLTTDLNEKTSDGMSDNIQIPEQKVRLDPMLSVAPHVLEQIDEVISSVVQGAGTIPLCPFNEILPPSKATKRQTSMIVQEQQPPTPTDWYASPSPQQQQ
ncbi:unnamed protein product, partial [Didymodactylos carnosus]